MFTFNKPLVSVVLASYNHVKFIKKAVASVLDQTYKNLELIVLDDGSTDGTPDIVEEIHDSRLKLIKLSPNRRFHPRNLGVKMAKGKYIAFQNSDDVWMPAKLKLQIDWMEKNRQTSICFTKLKVINEKNKEIKRSWAHTNLADGNKNNDAWLRLLFYSGINFGIASAVVRRDMINKIGGFCENMVQLADYDLWVRLLGLGQIYIVNETLTEMRLIKGVNLSNPKKEVLFRCTLENLDVLNRYTQWPINKYLDNIFPDIMPKNTNSIYVKYAALARFAWSLNTPRHQLFADQLVAELLNSKKSSKEILEYFGAELKKEYIRRRGKLEILIHK
jgi:glycosyltransferase involved in cell wall biosynthesis